MRVSKNVRRRVQLRKQKQAAAQKQATARKQICQPPENAELQKADVQQESKVADNEQWVTEDFSECDFGHVLRTRRLTMMARNMLECPNDSLPKQNAELQSGGRIGRKIRGQKNESRMNL